MVLGEYYAVAGHIGFGAKLMPGIWGMTRAAPLFIPIFT